MSRPWTTTRSDPPWQRSSPRGRRSTARDEGDGTEHILTGHFLTRHEAALAAGIPSAETSHRPDLLRIGGTYLEEVYFAFQFDGTGIRRDLGTVVQRLHRNHDDVTIADWLARPNPALVHLSPLEWARSRGDPSRLVEAATSFPPDAYL